VKLREGKIRIGVSSCLIGEAVRFNGGHKGESFLLETLSQYFEWVPVCPEVEIGLGVPRESMRLVKKAGAIHLVTNQTATDHTGPMKVYAAKKVKALGEQDISGYIFKKGSPSCGLERVNLYNVKGALVSSDQGMFAKAFTETLPRIPAEEEGRLRNPVLRENWIERVFAFARLKDLWDGKWNVGDLVAFHTKNKFALLAHNETQYRKLGRLVADAKKLDREELRDQYENLFLETLKTLATRKKNTNVLDHMTGYFKKQLDKDSRKEVGDTIHAYHQGHVPITVPLTLIKHYVRVFEVAYLKDQTFLNPHPAELSLRNFIA